MPKVIENLQKELLQKARKILLEEGYDSLTIRRVAGECGIAAGTVYNYYPSKEILTASVMLEDWQKMLSAVSAEAANADSAEKAFTAVFCGVSSFNTTYHPVWNKYSFKSDEQSSYAERHSMLVEQLSQNIHSILEKFPPEKTFSQAELFISENILICAGVSKVQFSSFLKIILFLLYNTDTYGGCK